MKPWPQVLFLVTLLAAPTRTLAAQEWKDNLRADLESKIKITKTDLDRARIKEPGTVLVVQHEGITASPSKDASMLVNKSKDGNVKQPGGLAVTLSDKKNNRDFAVGERLYCIDIKVKKDAVQLWLLSTEIQPIVVKGSTEQVRYKAALEFELSEDFLSRASADSVIRAMAAVLTPESATPGSPKTVALGQTESELEAAVGKPEKVLDLGAKKIYVYKDIKVTLVDGKVADVQ
jgi:hypothetical protein